jgi:hypothetical protein
MGRFSIVKTVYEKSEAAAVIHKLLARQASASASGLDPADLATRLVDLVWEEKAALLRDAPGQKPHKYTVAAMALAHGYQSLPGSELDRRAATVALSNVLAEIEVNGSYILNDLDRRLIEAAKEAFAEMLEAYNSTAVAD